MIGLLRQLFSQEQAVQGSKEIAKERLRLVLLHDRVNVSPQYIGLLKDDMIKAVSNYMEINEQAMEVNLSHEDQTVTLVANIPVNAVKRVPNAVANPAEAYTAPASGQDDDDPDSGLPVCGI